MSADAFPDPTEVQNFLDRYRAHIGGLDVAAKSRLSVRDVLHALLAGNHDEGTIRVARSLENLRSGKHQDFGLLDGPADSLPPTLEIIIRVARKNRNPSDVPPASVEAVPQ